MSLKIGSLLIVVGCLFAVVGLGFLPASFGPHPDASLQSAGAILFSAGMVLAASGLYVKSRVWAQSVPASAKSEKKLGRKTCKQCNKQEAVIQCRPHQVPLCTDCLAKHYDFRSCAYIPLERPAASKPPASKPPATKPQARSQSTTA
jgi:hypothetical protein